MKNLRCYVAALVGLGVFALCGTAQATIFTVSDITFSSLFGNDEGLKWTVSPVSDPSFIISGADISAGGAAIPFQFGTLTITEFAEDPLDSFYVSFKIAPPGNDIPNTGFVVATTSGGNKVAVDFDKTSGTLVNFGDTGVYKLTFDKVGKTTETTIKLFANFHYTTADTNVGGDGSTSDGPTPVPEPSTMVLLGSGLLGLIYVGRKRIRK